MAATLSSETPTWLQSIERNESSILGGYEDSLSSGMDNCGISAGTTIMAATFNGGVVLGADSRTSMGPIVSNRASRKISKIHHHIYVARSGSAADTQALAAIAKRHMTEHAMELGCNPRVSSAANLLKLIAYTNKNHLLAGLIVGGWDAKKGGQVFSIPLGGSLIEMPYAAGGSGSTYISALLDAQWRPNMTQGECKLFVRSSIAHAMARDGSSGGMIRIVTITGDGVVEENCPGDELPFELN